jgi:hypothetical protein
MPTASPLLTADQARELLSEQHDNFAAAHHQAWGQWQALQEVCRNAEAQELLLPLTATTRANIVNNHCVARIQELIRPKDGICVTNSLFLAVLVSRV